MKEDEIEEESILEEYDMGAKIGSGYYGAVWEVKHKETKQVFAIKKIRKAFCSATDARRTYREVFYLRGLQHTNVVELIGIIPHINDRDVHLLMHMMDSDLAQAIKSQCLRENHKRFVIYQLLRGLKYIHSAEVMHRDIKPANILINANAKIRIADFGYARSFSGHPKPDPLGPAENKHFGVGLLDVDEVKPVFTTYIGSRWYRAPELLLECKRVGSPVDMWSFGCILAELVGDVTIFPGTSTMHMVNLIAEVLGRPDPRELTAYDSKYKELVFAGMQAHRHVEWGVKFPPDVCRMSNLESQDMLSMVLTWCPLRRISSAELLLHPFVSRFSNPDDEIAMAEPLVPSLDDNLRLRVGDWRDHLYAELGIERVVRQLNIEREAREQILLEMEVVAERRAQEEADNKEKTIRREERRRMRAIARGEIKIDEEPKKEEKKLTTKKKMEITTAFMKSMDD